MWKGRRWRRVVWEGGFSPLKVRNTEERGRNTGAGVASPETGGGAREATPTAFCPALSGALLGVCCKIPWKNHSDEWPSYWDGGPGSPRGSRSRRLAPQRATLPAVCARGGARSLGSQVPPNPRRRKWSRKQGGTHEDRKGRPAIRILGPR